ncbi:MAG: hypothetical protein AAGD25_03275 [Cyanobacteria bacterium P01_F01_bin.150]
MPLLVDVYTIGAMLAIAVEDNVLTLGDFSPRISGSFFAVAIEIAARRTKSTCMD